MKTFVLTISAFAFVMFTAQSQVNTDVNKTTTTKKVVEKGTDVKTKVVSNTQTERDVLHVEGNEKEDQNTKVITNTSSDVQVIKDDLSINKANKELVKSNLSNQQLELQASVQAQLEIAALKKAAYDQKQLERQKELEARRAALESRPKGMAKLAKDK